MQAVGILCINKLLDYIFILYLSICYNKIQSILHHFQSSTVIMHAIGLFTIGKYTITLTPPAVFHNVRS